MAKSKKERSRLAKSSANMAWGAGIIGGLNSRNIIAKRGFSKGNAAALVATSVAGIGATVQNVRASKTVGEGVTREFVNTGRTVAGSFGASILSGVAGKAILKVKPLSRKAGTAFKKAKKAKAAAKAKKTAVSEKGFKGAKAAKDVKNPGKKKTKFIRINGRVVPIKGK